MVRPRCGRSHLFTGAIRRRNRCCERLCGPGRRSRPDSRSPDGFGASTTVAIQNCAPATALGCRVLPSLNQRSRRGVSRLIVVHSPAAMVSRTEPGERSAPRTAFARLLGSAQLRKSHPVDALTARYVRVLAVAEIPPEGARAVFPAYLITRAPRWSDPDGNGCRAPGIALARLAWLAAG